MASSEHNLKNIVFTTYHRNQVLKLGYDDLFSNRRVIIFSLTNIYGNMSYPQLKKFDNEYEKIKALGFDDIYCISSDELTIAPWADIHAKNIIGLPDNTHEFLKIVAQHSGLNAELDDMAQYWQYIAIIDNGSIEKLLYNYIKKDLPLRILKSEKYRYHNLGLDGLYTYLNINQTPT
jgi:peroxiredoxin